MTTKTSSASVNLEEFVRNAEEARKITLTDEDIKRINDLSREVERAEEEIEKNTDNGIAAKKSDNFSHELNI